MRSPRRLRHKLEKLPETVGATLDSLMGVLPASQTRVAADGVPKAYGKWGWVKRKAKPRAEVKHKLR